MEELIENAKEFLASAEDNLKKERWNAAVSDFFKAIIAFYDYLIYTEIKILPKSHTDRFNLLRNHFKKTYYEIRQLFKTYRDSYTLRLVKNDALKMQKYAHELKNKIIP